jgi:hypothetical protein
MKPLSLLLLGVVVGWAASGLDWSRDVQAQDALIDARPSTLQQDVPDAPPPALVAACEEETEDMPRHSGEAGDIQSLDVYYREKVLNADRSALFELQRSDDVGLALRAAWELVIREATEREPKDPDQGVEIAALSSAHHFAGFAEGRLRKSIPAWWSGAILDGNFWQHWSQQGDAFGFAPGASEKFNEAKWRVGPLPANFYGYHPVKGSEDGLTMGSGDFDWTKDVMTITLGDRRIQVPEQIVKATQPFNVIVFDTVSGSAVIGTCNRQFAVPYPISRLRDDGGTALWTTQVLGGQRGFIGNMIGMSHFVEFVAKDGLLYVYGLTRNLAYVEAFEFESGRPRFRFSTEYGLKPDPADVEEKASD